MGEEILIHSAKFPYSWNVPDFLNEKDNQYVLLPLTTNIFHRRQDEKTKVISPFDFEKNEWLNENRLLYLFPNLNKDTRNHLKKRIKEQKAIVQEVNNDRNHKLRIYFGELALSAYRKLFMQLVAPNRSGLEDFANYSEIPWGDFTKETFAKSYWKFSYIKARAKYKKVEFKLLKSDFSLFQRYLNLRKALIEAYGEKEENCGLLFFSFTKRGFNRFSETKKFFKHFSEVPHFNSLISRATKSDVLLHETDNIRLISEILQNSPNTIIKNYARGTVSGHVTEIGNFVNNLSKIVKLKKSKNHEVESELGGCASFSPAPLDIKPMNIEVNCASKEGCLFCEKFIVHADSKDVRKLLSYLFFLQEVEVTLSDTYHFQIYFDPIVKRIQTIINYIKSLSTDHQEMVVKIEEEVFEDGLITKFFEQEIELQESMKITWNH
ncbi:MAG: hypothetical protein GYB58_20230 [Gammaproteobacteria bacterium]|nr:hypothetical protein [Gammaproteobacteria bacterium]